MVTARETLVSGGRGGEDRAERWAGGKADARGDGFRVRGEEPANTALRPGGL